MADKKISELTNITGANLADADEFVVVDTSASETKAITYGELKKFTGTVTADGLTVQGDGTAGAATIQGASTKAALKIERTTTSVGAGYLGASDTEALVVSNSSFANVLSAHSNGDISFYEDTGTTPKFFWDASAEALGIGTSNPARPFTVSAGAGASILAIQDANTGNTATDGFQLQLASAGDMFLWNYENASTAFGTNNTERMRIDSSGNVGIGTSVPATRLNIDQGADSNGITLAYSGRGASRVEWELSGVNNEGMAFIHNNGTNRHVMSVMSRDVLNFRTNNTERMRIDASGNLLVGTTTTAPGVNNTTAGSAIQSGGTFCFSSDAITGYVNRNADGSLVTWRRSGAEVGSISITTSTTAYNITSDYRLKEDVQPMVGASDRVLALNPVNFAWKADNTRTDGFIAHEAQAVAPYAVTGEKDGEEMQSIDHSKLVPLLTAALQEALTEIAALKDRVAALEA